jgi:hypothetical protein
MALAPSLSLVGLPLAQVPEGAIIPTPGDDYQHVVREVRGVGDGFTRVTIDVFHQDDLDSRRRFYDFCWSNNKTIEVAF